MTAYEPDGPGDASAALSRPATALVDDDAASRARARHGRGLPSPRAWSLWAHPVPAVAFVLAVDALALAACVLAPLGHPVRRADLGVLALLAAGAVVHLELVRHVERIREVESGLAPYVDAKSAWSFAGVVLLPPGPALVLVAVTFAYWWWRVSRRPPAHRWFFTFATVVLGSVAAEAVLSIRPGGATAALVAGPTGVLLLAAAVTARWVVNFGLVVAVIRLTAPGVPWRQRLGSPTQYFVGIGALGLGVALAAMIDVSPWLMPLLLVPAVALHRNVLLPQFARAARGDPKTGLPNVTHWRDQVARELARMRRRGGGSLGVLMVDLDEFKHVNDEHGHLAGDAVLCAVADLLRAEIRAYDVAGRFGGEEFVVLLVDTPLDEIAAVGERLRRGIDTLAVPVPGGTVHGLSASLGAAAYPYHGGDVDDLLAAADTALYAAKRGGRNRVEIAPG